MSNITIDEVVEKYITIRSIKRDLERDHEEALKPISEKLEKLESWLLGRMADDGVENYKTKSGTAYKTKKTSCTIADQSMFKGFVFEPVLNHLKDLGVVISPDTLMAMIKWNLVDFRSLKSGVEMFIEDHGQVPPGLNITQTTTVNVRSK